MSHLFTLSVVVLNPGGFKILGAAKEGTLHHLHEHNIESVYEEDKDVHIQAAALPHNINSNDTWKMASGLKA